MRQKILKNYGTYDDDETDTMNINWPVLRIRDVYPGSECFSTRIRIFSILDPGSASKNLSILTQKIGF